MPERDYNIWVERNEMALWDNFINDNNHLPYKINNDINEEFEEFCVDEWKKILREASSC